MSSFLNILLALIILSIVVVIHEFGHFIFARINGVEVIEFSLGMGPTLLSKNIKGTIFSLKLLPIGGACMMKGEDSGDNTPGSFGSKNVWQRISIVLAGPVFNFILAFILAIFIIVFGGYDPAYVNYVEEGSGAAEAGLREDDLIKSINGEKIAIGRDAMLYFMMNEVTEEPIEMVVERDGEEITLSVPNEEITQYFMGISYSASDDPATVTVTDNYPAQNAGMITGDTIVAINGTDIGSGNELQKYFEEHPLDENPVSITYKHNTKEYDITITPEWNTLYQLSFSYNTYRYETPPSQVLKYSLTEVRFWISSTIDSLKYLVSGNAHREDVGSAVRVVSEISDTVEDSKEMGTKYVILNLIYWAIVISANLGVMNLLPIPALDGGRLLFMFIEVIRGKPLSPEKEGIIHFIGFILLMILMVFLFYNDIVYLLR
ncbi:MAG: RIP metalloprotease RseP [Lachnospiraceae bacterium]|nr:RIP metalloprotease RseP [Lachnospiraceae bacterium]